MKSNVEILEQEPNYFSGKDTYGTEHVIGIRKDGVKFLRSYKFNGYGMSYTKWKMVEGEEYNVLNTSEGEKYIKWGWNKLTGTYSKNIRLPALKKGG